MGWIKFRRPGGDYILTDEIYIKEGGGPRRVKGQRLVGESKKGRNKKSRKSKGLRWVWVRYTFILHVEFKTRFGCGKTYPLRQNREGGEGRPGKRGRKGWDYLGLLV